MKYLVDITTRWLTIGKNRMFVSSLHGAQIVAKDTVLKFINQTLLQTLYMFACSLTYGDD